MNYFNRFKNNFDVFQNDPQDSTSLPNNQVQCLFVDKQDQFWIGTASGLSRLQPESNSFITILHGYSISTLYEDAQSNLWAGTSVQGLFKLDANRNFLQHYISNPLNPDGLSSNEIRGITEDAEHNLWVATIDGGLNLYRKDSNTFAAFKHNPANPVSIRNNTLFTIFLDQNQVLLAGLENGGIGIPEDFREKIFYPFVQARNVESPAIKGTGIGLALTRELVEIHEGSVSVTSQPNQGSVFTIVLPLDLKASIPDGSDKRVETAQQYEAAGTKEVTEAATEAGIACNAPMVLLVDDELDFRRFLIDELCSEYRFLEAADGETAYQMTMTEHPDLIVSDVRMPRMDGFTLCSTLKQNPDTSHIPIILLTSKTDEKSRIDGFDHGADDYIAKPFDVNLLRIRIANLMDSRKMLKDLYSHEIYLQPKNIVITPDDERFLKRVMECIEDQMDNCDFNVTHLGRGIGLSRVQLYRKVKALTDLTPNDLIKTLRLKRAAQLLEESQLTVFEIAYQVGFKDPSYFSKCFRNQFSTSPAVYAHAHFRKSRQESSKEIKAE